MVPKVQTNTRIDKDLKDRAKAENIKLAPLLEKAIEKELNRLQVKRIKKQMKGNN